MAIKILRVAAQCAALLLLVSCASTPDATLPESPTALEPSSTQATEPPAADAAGSSHRGQEPKGQDKVVLGTGEFVQAARGPERSVHAGEDGVTLNFEQADLREFLKVIFDTILKENYIVDPSVAGSVTLHTTRPITQETVLPTVESVLQMNGLAVLYDDGVYRIVPLAGAEQATRSPAVGQYTNSRSVGYSTQVVPLQYASATEIQKILAPFIAEGSVLRVDAARNVLILSGPKFRLEELLAMVRTFDVDWLRGMSFAMFRLEYADAVTMVEELEQIIGVDSDTPLVGIVRLLPIERLNAVLVITHRPDHIANVRQLIEEFDFGVGGSGGRRLFVYELENGKAENIANALQEIFGISGSSSEDRGAPARDPGSVFRPATAVTQPVREPGNRVVAQAQAATALAAEGDGIGAERVGDIKVIADTDNNSILVLASQEDYRSIEAAIRRLDRAQRQVLIEATIAEVSLSDNLNYGVRWFLEENDWQLGFNAPVPTSASGDGLTLAFFDSANSVRAFFDLLAAKSDVKFLSTPQVMVLDNQTANIRVGDQIPVTTRSSQSTTNPDAPIVTEVQFRDTGTLLTVTPRVNAGGQVMLEISLEVSIPGATPAVGGGGNVAIAQRTITSSVIVQSGQTVVLGGLILENTTEGVTGVPILMDIPLLGKLFSSTSQDVFRTELLITVKPLVITNDREMMKVTEELRMQIRKASDLETSIKSRGPES
jgi:general secretion pathway protein D